MMTLKAREKALMPLKCERGIKMADFNEIFEGNKDKLTDVADSKEHFSKLTTKLSELGFDVLINDKKKADFIPSSRLSEVVSQRDTFRTQATELSTQLEALKKAANGNTELQTKISDLMNTNNDLLIKLEQTTIDSELITAASDMLNPKDILVFVEKNNIKKSARGEILGIDAELTRLKTERPYLFKSDNNNPGNHRRGGSDRNGGDRSSGKMDMNFLIRKSAGI